MRIYSAERKYSIQNTYIVFRKWVSCGRGGGRGSGGGGGGVGAGSKGSLLSHFCDKSEFFDLLLQFYDGFPTNF